MKISNASEDLPPPGADAAPDSEAELARLAGLPPLEYDRAREAAAKALGVRTSTLDAEVARRRPATGEALQGEGVEFAAPEPWTDPVDGVTVLDAVVAALLRYVSLPPGAADSIALWTAAAHCFEAFIHTPRLNLQSPEKQCGKTTLLDVLASVLPRPLRTESVTPAVLFRLVELHKPTLLLDEVDTYLADNDELRGLLNAGHKRGAKAYRCEGENNTVRGFSVFAPAVLAGIGGLPGTLHDRSIVIRLVRAKPGEVPARYDSRRTAAEQQLRRQLARWAADHAGQLAAADPALPQAAYNRVADNWRPLFAVAVQAGGDWPRRAEAAFVALTAQDDPEAQGVGETLLADIRVIFGERRADRISSTDLAETLHAIEGRPWAEWGRQKRPISTNQIASLLRRFGVKSRAVRIGDKTPRGYLEADFRESFSRYLPETPFSGCNSATSIGAQGDYAFSGVQQPETMLHPEKCINANNDGPCCTVAPWNGGCPDEAPVAGQEEAAADPAGEML